VFVCVCVCLRVCVRVLGLGFPQIMKDFGGTGA